MNKIKKYCTFFINAVALFFIAGPSAATTPVYQGEGHLVRILTQPTTEEEIGKVSKERMGQLSNFAENDLREIAKKSHYSLTKLKSKGTTERRNGRNIIQISVFMDGILTYASYLGIIDHQILNVQCIRIPPKTFTLRNSECQRRVDQAYGALDVGAGGQNG